MDFINYLRSFDIISLVETWGNFEGEFSNFLSSYTTFENVRVKKPGSGRNSGGVCAFVKDWLMRANLIERIFPEMKDCVVLHFKSSEFLNTQDTVLYSLHMYHPKGLPFMTICPKIMVLCY